VAASAAVIEFLSYGDTSSPPKTVEQVHRLVEQDEVDFRSARFISAAISEKSGWDARSLATSLAC